MSDFQDRLRTFVGSLGISMQEFERQCDIKAGTAGKMTEKSYSTTFHKIRDSFPQLNVDWLKTGNGEMLNATKSNANTQGDNNNNQQGDGNFYYNGASPELIAYISRLEKENEISKVKISHLEGKIEDLKHINTINAERIEDFKSRIEELKRLVR